MSELQLRSRAVRFEALVRSYVASGLSVESATLSAAADLNKLDASETARVEADAFNKTREEVKAQHGASQPAKPHGTFARLGDSK